MLFDLKGDPQLAPTVGLLFSAVVRNYQRLLQITQGMTQEEVDYRGPDGQSNSPAQLIRHLTYVDLNWAYRFKGQPLPQPYIEQYGPMIDEQGKLPMVSGMPYETLIARYDAVMGMLKEACLPLTDADLENLVNFGHHNENQATIRWGIWHIADHSRYHQAHINLLRKEYRQQT